MGDGLYIQNKEENLRIQLVSRYITSNIHRKNWIYIKGNGVLFRHTNISADLNRVDLGEVVTSHLILPATTSGFLSELKCLFLR